MTSHNSLSLSSMSMSTSKNVDAYIHILPALEHVRPPPSPIILKQAESVFIWCYIGRALEKKNGQKTQNPSSLAPSTALDRYMSGTPRNCSSGTNLWEDLRLFGEREALNESQPIPYQPRIQGMKALNSKPTSHNEKMHREQENLNVVSTSSAWPKSIHCVPWSYTTS